MAVSKICFCDWRSLPAQQRLHYSGSSQRSLSPVTEIEKFFWLTASHRTSFGLELGPRIWTALLKLVS